MTMERLGDDLEGSSRAGYDVTRLGKLRKLLTHRVTGETTELIYRDRKRVPCANGGVRGSAKKSIFSALVTIFPL